MDSTDTAPTLWDDERSEAYRRARGLGLVLVVMGLVAASSVAALIVAALR